MRNRKWLAMIALLGALSLVAAACAEGDDEGPGETGPTGVTEPTGPAVDCDADPFGCVEVGAGEPILLGGILTISQNTAYLGTDSQHGVELAIDFLDGALDGAPGQFLGHDITFQVEDETGATGVCAAEGGQAAATAWAANPDVVAVIGTSCTSAALGVADTILSEKGIVLFSPSNTNPGLTAEGTHQPFYFRTAHNDRIQGAIDAEFAYNELGARTAATINDESPYADGLAAAFRNNFEALGGTITAIEAVNSGDTDFKPLLTSIGEGAPDVLFFPDFNPVCGLLTQQASDIMPDTVLIGADGCLESAFIDTAGDAWEGVYASAPDLSVFASGDFYQNEFLPAYKEQFGVDPTSVFHAHAFDAFNVLFQAIEAVAVQNADGSLTIPRTALRDALQATSGYEGITGTITCTPLGDCATDVKIGVFLSPDWPVEGGNPNAKPAYSDTKSLADVA